MHDIAQICLNGHIINGSSTRQPERNQKYCSDCGEKVIDRCLKCGNTFIGDLHMEGMYFPMGKKVPQYCPNCGEAYPWTNAKFEALNDMIDLMDEFEGTEKEELKEIGKVISTNNPKSEVSVYKIKKYLGKIGNSAGEKLESLFIEVASETAIKAMKEVGILPK